VPTRSDGAVELVNHPSHYLSVNQVPGVPFKRGVSENRWKKTYIDSERFRDLLTNTVALG